MCGCLYSLLNFLQVDALVIYFTVSWGGGVRDRSVEYRCRRHINILSNLYNPVKSMETEKQILCCFAKSD